MDIYTHFVDKTKSQMHLRRYIKLIEHYTTNISESQGETHHILPKCLFPEHKNNKNNLIKLPIRAHYLAHYFLHKCLGGKMTQAFFMMCKRLQKTKSKSYEQARLYQRDIMRKSDPAKTDSIFKTHNPNWDGSHSKNYWKSASEERRKKQSSICTTNNTKYKSMPKEIRNYNCSWCEKQICKEEFIHHAPKHHYYCNASCRGYMSKRCPVRLQGGASLGGITPLGECPQSSHR
jgi:hypothetical protein